jgi:hypothetical protein
MKTAQVSRRQRALYLWPHFGKANEYSIRTHRTKHYQGCAIKGSRNTTFTVERKIEREELMQRNKNYLLPLPGAVVSVF